jgi:hypothetical protein
MKFILVVAIFSATSTPQLRVHEDLYSKQECQTMAQIMKAQAGAITTVLTECIGVRP